MNLDFSFSFAIRHKNEKEKKTFENILEIENKRVQVIHKNSHPTSECNLGAASDHCKVLRKMVVYQIIYDTEKGKKKNTKMLN